ncbi:MAG: AbrB/MazE/SpoVT family DNA-binding domain-containing protein [Bacilli bacterium]
MTSGIVRRIDNLGRVVIPKEIRKTLKIKENEQVEINVLDDSIVLNKYSDIHEYDKSINNLIDIIKNVYDRDIIITNLDKIVLTTKDYKDYINLELSPYLANIVDNRKDVSELIPVNLNLNSNMSDIKVSYSIKSIIVNGDMIGLLILLSNTNLENSDLKLLQLMSLYLENYLE